MFIPAVVMYMLWCYLVDPEGKKSTGFALLLCFGLLLHEAAT